MICIKTPSYPTTAPRTMISISLDYEDDQQTIQKYEGIYTPQEVGDFLTTQKKTYLIAKFCIIDSWKDVKTGKALARKTFSYHSEKKGKYNFTYRFHPNSTLNCEYSPSLNRQLALFITKNAGKEPDEIKKLLDKELEIFTKTRTILYFSSLTNPIQST